MVPCVRDIEENIILRNKHKRNTRMFQGVLVGVSRKFKGAKNFPSHSAAAAAADDDDDDDPTIAVVIAYRARNPRQGSFVPLVRLSWALSRQLYTSSYTNDARSSLVHSSVVQLRPTSERRSD